MTVQLNLDFSKETLSKTVLDILRNGLKDEPKSKLSYEECLIRVSQGKKLEYGAANYLLSGLIKTLYMEDSPQGDEYQPGERAEDIDLGKDLSMSQNLAVARSPEQEDETSDTSPQTGNPTQSTSTAPHPPLVDVRPKGKATKVPGADTKKRKSADSTTEDTAPRKKIAGSITPQSAKSSIISGVFRQTQKDATASAKLFTQTPAEALYATKHVAGTNVDSTT